MAQRQTTSDEAQLAHRLRRGDQTALADVLRLWGGTVKGVLLRKYRGAVCESDLEDVLSMALYRLWQARKRFDSDKGSLRTWFFRIAENGLRDVLRFGWHKARKLETAVPVDQLAGRQPDASDGEAAAIDDDLRLALREALENLSEPQRRIVVADAFSGNGSIASADLAAELGLSAATIRVYRKRALETLRNELTKRGFSTEKTAD